MVISKFLNMAEVLMAISILGIEVLGSSSLILN